MFTSQILSFIVTTQITDQPTFAAIRLTCRKLRFYSDSCTIWKDIPLLYPNGSIRLQSFRLDRRPDIAGTEGFCMKVTCKANGSPYALKEARPFPKVLSTTFAYLHTVTRRKWCAYFSILSCCDIQFRTKVCHTILFEKFLHLRYEVHIFTNQWYKLSFH